jgi:hypothetical protein
MAKRLADHEIDLKRFNLHAQQYRDGPTITAQIRKAHPPFWRRFWTASARKRRAPMRGHADQQSH